MNEMWKPIIGFRRTYWISRDGAIRADAFKDKRGAIHKEKAMTPHLMANGYMGICLGGGVGKRMCYVHRMLAEAFIPNPDGKPHINHKDGNRLNNRLDNLEWCTHGENMQHAGAMGRMARRGNGNARKLTDEQVQRIRQLLVMKTPQRAIADLFGVSQGAIGWIARAEHGIEE